MLFIAQHRVKPSSHSILRNHLEAQRSVAPVAAETEPTKDVVVSKHSCRRSQRTAIAQIDFARVVPRAAMMRLIEPRLTVRRGFNAATCAAIVLLTGEPVAVVRLRRTCVHQGPRTQVRRVSQA